MTALEILAQLLTMAGVVIVLFVLIEAARADPE